MAMYGSTWRQHPLIIGSRYVSNKEKPEFTEEEFIKGIAYELQSINHSHYDSASVFTFKNSETEELVSYWWFDNANDDLCYEYFTHVI